MKAEFDFESIKNKAIEQLKAGKPLLGKDGAFAPLLESILNAAPCFRKFRPRNRKKMRTPAISGSIHLSFP